MVEFIFYLGNKMLAEFVKLYRNTSLGGIFLLDKDMRVLVEQDLCLLVRLGEGFVKVYK